MLLLLSGDVESNPGPIEHCLSIIHSNIRRIRNKLEFIKNTLVDFDVLCSTESHFDASIDLVHLYYQTYVIAISKRQDKPWFVYLNKNIISQRMADLEIYWNGCVWIKITQKSESFLLSVLYIPETADGNFFEQLNLNIEAALNI